MGATVMRTVFTLGLVMLTLALKEGSNTALSVALPALISYASGTAEVPGIGARYYLLGKLTSTLLTHAIGASGGQPRGQPRELLDLVRNNVTLTTGELLDDRQRTVAQRPSHIRLRIYWNDPCLDRPISLKNFALVRERRAQRQC